MFCEKCGAVMKEGSLFCPKCGAKQGTVAVIKAKAPVENGSASEIEAQNTLIHEIWPDWTITEKIGEGSFGKVYRAKREDIGSTVYSAIKIIKVPQSQSEADSVRSEIGLDDQSTTAYFRSFVDDCVNEIKTMESLKGTQNIVSVEDYKVIEDESGFGWTIIIRMELLTSFVEHTRDKTLSEKEVIKLGIDMCNALEFCAKLNIMHRDIKPENIFISSFGIYKLGDFGIARKLEKSTSGMSKKGTYNYMAPEIYNGSTSYDFTSDIYSLGIVLYKLLNNNRFPLVDARGNNVTHQQMQDAFDKRQAGAVLPKPLYASDALASVILTACAFDPKKRFATASAMKMALTNVQNGTADRAQTPTPAPVKPVNQTGTVGVIDKRKTPSTPVHPYTPPKTPVKTFDTNPPAPPKQKKPKKEKKKMSKGKKALVIILTVLIILVVGTGTLGVLYLTSSGQKIVRALDKGDYNAALSIYNEDVDGDAGGMLVLTLKNRLNQTKDSYVAGTIEYEVANLEVSAIEKMNISAIADTVKEVKTTIANLNSSRTSFNTAETMFGKEDYAGAIENYKKVIEDDTNYEAAKSKLATAIEKYRAVRLEAAANFVTEGSYTKAIAELENALKVIPDDVKISEQLTVYRNEYAVHMKEDAINTAADYAGKEDYANAISSIQTAMKDNEDDAELKALLDEYSNKYVSAVVAKVDELTGKKNYTEAISTLEAALKVLPGNESLKTKLDAVKAKQPVALSTLTPINGGWEWNEGVPTDPFQNTYTNVTNFKIFYGEYEDTYSAEYRLYGKYKTLTGSAVSHADITENGNSQIKIYADEKLVYTSPSIVRKTDLFDFVADVSGADYVKIVVEVKDNHVLYGRGTNALIAMNLQLWTE